MHNCTCTHLCVDEHIPKPINLFPSSHWLVNAVKVELTQDHLRHEAGKTGTRNFLIYNDKRLHYPTFTKQYIPGTFFLLEAQFRAFEITSQKVRFTCLLNGLTSEVAKLFYDSFEKPPTKPYDILKFAILKHMEEPKLEFSRQLPKELMNGVAKGPWPQVRYNSDPDPPQTDSDDSSSTILAQLTEFDIEQFLTSNPEHSEELLPISSDFNSNRREKKRCPHKQASATHKRRIRGERNP
ncbi:hypothetical protein ACTXT7_002690 [Hymenolepis weldensis]